MARFSEARRETETGDSGTEELNTDDELDRDDDREGRAWWWV